MIKVLKTVLLSVFVTAAVLMLLALGIAPSLSYAVEAQAEPVLAETQESTSYWLREYNGHIAVFFSSGDETPAIETTIEVDSLRDIDQEMLKNGIEAATYEDVLKLLEDFGS